MVAEEPAELKTFTEEPGGNRTEAEVQMLDAGVVANYANFCRISGTPEELLIDFGLNPQPMAQPPLPVKVDHRIVTNWYTAKRLLYVLHMTVQRHEAIFGPLELNVENRVVKRS